MSNVLAFFGDIFCGFFSWIGQILTGKKDFLQQMIEDTCQRSNQLMKINDESKDDFLEDQRQERKLRFKRREIERLEQAVELFKQKKLLEKDVIDFINKNPQLFKELQK